MHSSAVKSPGRRIGRVVFHLVMTVLVVMLALRTYEETAIAHARSAGSLRTAWATVVKTNSHTTSGETGGGQDGGGKPFISGSYSVELRVDGERRTVDEIGSDAAQELSKGRTVEVGLWHGRVVEIAGHPVWPGWHITPVDGTLFVLYPLIMGYLIALAVSARAYVARRTSRARLTRDDRFGALWPGLIVGTAAIFALLICGALGKAPVYWPVVPVGAGVTVALLRSRGLIRRRDRLSSEEAG